MIFDRNIYTIVLLSGCIVLCYAVDLIQVYMKGIQMWKDLQKVIYTQTESGRGEIRNVLCRKPGCSHIIRDRLALGFSPHRAPQVSLTLCPSQPPVPAAGKESCCGRKSGNERESSHKDNKAYRGRNCCYWQWLKGGVSLSTVSLTITHSVHSIIKPHYFYSNKKY